jgi:hypothetical protein
MTSIFSATKSESFLSLSPAGYLQPAQQKVMDLFTDDSIAMTRKQIAAAVDMELSSVCGRVNALVAAGRLVSRGERKDPRTGKQQELVGLSVRGQQELFQ